MIPGLGRSPGGENGNPFWYSCLEDPMDRGAWRATGHRVAKNQTQLSTHVCPETHITPHGICLDSLMEEWVTDPVHDASCLTVHTVHTVR